MNKNIPVKAAKEFAEKLDKDQVIIVAYSNKKDRTYVTTYGKTETDCDQACQAGNWLKSNMLEWPYSDCLIEPSRVRNLKSKIKKLKAEIKELKNA